MNRPELSEALRASLERESWDDAARLRRFWLSLPDGSDGSELQHLDWIARRELERVHARELGYLLREAARLGAAREPRARAWLWLVGRPGTLGAWRRSFGEALELLARERCQISPCLEGLLLRCAAAARPPSSRPDRVPGATQRAAQGWPSTLELVEAALELSPDEAGRLAHAGTLLAQGEFRAAERAAESELDPWLPPRREGEFLAVLACAREGRGRLDDALHYHELALARVASTEGAVYVASHLLYLSLALGRGRTALRAAAALALQSQRPEFDPRAFERCTADLRRVTARLRGERAFGVHPALERHYLRCVAACGAAVRQVAVALG